MMKLRSFRIGWVLLALLWLAGPALAAAKPGKQIGRAHV